MKTSLKRAAVLLFLTPLAACVDLNDPWNRIQGEPSENNETIVGPGESGPAQLTVEPEGGAAGEAGEAAGAEEHDEGH